MKQPKPLDRLVSRLLGSTADGDTPSARIAALPGAVRPAGPVRHQARTKLWDLEEKHLCPVVGTCVPMHELAALQLRHHSVIHVRILHAGVPALVLKYLLYAG